MDKPFSYDAKVSTPITPRITLDGNKIECLKWLGFAKTKLRELVEQMDNTGLDQGARHVHPQPGVTIKVMKSFTMTFVLIKTGAVPKEVIEYIYKWYWYAVLTGGTLHYMTDVNVDGVQNVWTCGGYSNSLTPFEFGESAMIVKYSTDGELILAKILTKQTQREYPDSVCIDSANNLYLGLYNYSSYNSNPIPDGQFPRMDGAVIKFNSSGVVQWSRMYGLRDNAFQPRDIQMGATAIYFCGWIEDYFQYVSFEWSIRWIGYIKKINPDTGALIWKRFMHYRYDKFLDQGTYPGWAGPDGQFKVWGMRVDSEDSLCCIGLDTGDVNYYNDAGGFGQGTVFKFNSSGTLQWHKQIYLTVDPILFDAFWAVDIVVDSTDNLHVLCGHSDRTSNSVGVFVFYLVTLTSAGSMLRLRTVTVPYSNGEGNWSTLFPSNPRVAINSKDEVYMFVNSYTDPDGHYIFKFGADGTLLWQRSLISVKYAPVLVEITIDQDDDILITGNTATHQSFTIKLPGHGGFLGKHTDIDCADPQLATGTSGVGIRDADSEGLLIIDDTALVVIGSASYSDWAGTYATEDLPMTSRLNKILVEKEKKLGA